MSEDIGNTFAQLGNRSRLDYLSSLWLIQIDGSDLMSCEMDFVDSIFGRWSHSHRITTKCLAYLKLAITKKDFAVSLHLPHLISNSVLERRQLLGERAVAHLITTGRYGHAQGFMWPLVIVTMTPAIKTTLHAFKVVKDALRQQLYFQGAMKAFVFTLGLRMIRPTVTNGNPQGSNQTVNGVC